MCGFREEDNPEDGDENDRSEDAVKNVVAAVRRNAAGFSRVTLDQKTPLSPKWVMTKTTTMTMTTTRGTRKVDGLLCR